MNTLLDTIDIFSMEIWEQDREAAVDLGVVIDCLREDMPDPADDAHAASCLIMTICDDRPLLEPWLDAIIAEIKKVAS